MIDPLINNFFICVDDYITSEHCDYYINLYEKNVNSTYNYNDTKPLRIKADNVVKNIIQNFNIKYGLDNLEIVKRTAPSKMDNHFDSGDAIAFILYLNNNFMGGETVFENETTIVPKPGRLLIFSNGTLLHKVNEITQGNRYVIAGWFK